MLGHKGKVISFVADVTDYDAIQEMEKTAVEKFGTVDVWLNNVGMSSGHRLFIDSTPENEEQSIGLIHDVALCKKLI